jgi:hypothetical protein
MLENAPGAVAHACNPSTWEVEIRRIAVRGQPRPHHKIPYQNNQSKNRLEVWFKW